MKTASSPLHILALGVLLAIHVAGPTELRMPGVRKALQTMDSQAVSVIASHCAVVAKIG